MFEEWVELDYLATFNTWLRCESEECMGYQEHNDCNRKRQGKDSASHDMLGGFRNLICSFIHVHGIDSHGTSYIAASSCCGEEKLYKQLMVVVSYTISNPRTMMIHLKYTLSTDRTVMSSWRLDLLTFLTIPVNNKILDIKIPVTLHDLSILLSYSVVNRLNSFVRSWSVEVPVRGVTIASPCVQSRWIYWRNVDTGGYNLVQFYLSGTIRFRSWSLNRVIRLLVGVVMN